MYINFDDECYVLWKKGIEVTHIKNHLNIPNASRDLLKSPLWVFILHQLMRKKNILIYYSNRGRPPGGKTLCRSLVTCKGFFHPATPAVILIWLMVLLFENGFSGWGQIHLCSCKSFAKIVPIQKNYIS